MCTMIMVLCWIRGDMETYKLTRGFLGGSVVKILLAVQEMRVRSLSQEDPLEKEMATHSSILSWEIPWAAKPGWIQCLGLQKSRT